MCKSCDRDDSDGGVMAMGCGGVTMVSWGCDRCVVECVRGVTAWCEQGKN